MTLCVCVCLSQRGASDTDPERQRDKEKERGRESSAPNESEQLCLYCARVATVTLLRSHTLPPGASVQRACAWEGGVLGLGEAGL